MTTTEQTTIHFGKKARYTGVLLVAAGLFSGQTPYAAVSEPYVNDADTVYLFHLDEPAGSGTAVWEGAGGGSAAYCVGNSANEVTDVLGATGFFGGAANMMGASTERGIGIDADSPADGFDYDDRINFNTIIKNGQFTLEALIKPGTSDLADNGEIWCMDDSDSTRGFQFRLNSSEQLEWHPIGLGGIGPVVASVGAIDADTWYHVALTYASGTYVMYWTPLTGAYSEAQVLHTWYSALTVTDLTAPLVLGNEARSIGGMNEAFSGLIDEARISSIARSPDEFITSFGDNDDDGLPDSWEQLIIDADAGDAIEDILDVNPEDDFDGDGISNGQEYLLGLDPVEPLDSGTDSDGDYLPDVWEFSRFGNLDYNAYDDPDSDGYNNQAERIGETDPLQAGEYPDFHAPSVAYIRDSVITNNALLMAGGSYGRAINGISYQEQILQTFGDYQYTAYYDTVGSVQTICLARRTVDEAAVGPWEIIRTDSEFLNGDESSWDAHNVISFGICPADGTLHMAWDHHNNTLRYRRSVPGLCTTNTAAWGAGMLLAEQNWLVDSSTPEYDVTYPQFVATPDGKLVLNRRIGISGRGDQLFQIYDPASGGWRSHVEFISRDGTYTGVNPYGSIVTATERCAYINGFDIDTNGTMHVTWTWRESQSQYGNRDICYAYSPDQGVSWYNNAGSKVADTGLGQYMTMNSAGMTVVPLDMQQLLINQQAQCVDNEGRVHALMLHRRQDPGYEPAYFTAIFSTKFAAYYHYFRDPASGEWTQRRIPPDAYPVGSRPRIGYDAEGNVYAAYLSYPAGTVVFPGYRENDDYSVLVIASASKASAYTDWEILQVIDQDFDGEPLLDQARLLNDNILAIYIQEHDTYTSGDGIPTPLHVYEFAVDVPEPASAGRIACSFMGDDVLISAYGQTGTNYQLQTIEDLADTNGWSEVGASISGMNSLLVFPSVDGLQNRQSFYKVSGVPAL
ncbi:MAG: BNR-4 repeat-containing protein [Pontiellaceae bacterium]|nr:BNR-4 repeat-containing protein [Pontiellaceae bacterium]MBN2785611.1 BNR-4 repeat-containing protein [Pontiellaceae bacterium]